MAPGSSLCLPLLLHFYQPLVRGLLGNHTQRAAEWSTAGFHCCVNPPWQGEAALPESGRVDPSATTDIQQNTHPCQADTDPQTNRQTHSQTHTHSQDGVPHGHRREDSEGVSMGIQPQLPLSNTTTHMPVNRAVSRAPSETFSSTTHGVHHFLRNSPFPIINTHLCTITKASSRLKHTHTGSRVFTLTHIQYI